jgi:hypothetical protein
MDIDWKTATKEAVLPIITLIVVALCVLTSILWIHERNNSHTLNAQMKGLQMQVAGDQYAAYTQITAEPTEDKVYIPQLRLALPLNNTTMSLMYSLRTDTATSADAVIEADITTHAEAATLVQQARVRSCSSVVRIKFEAKADPYNLQEKAQASVTLDDGRVLQIYSYHLDSCNQEWQSNGIDPDAIAALFQEATSY